MTVDLISETAQRGDAGQRDDSRSGKDGAGWSRMEWDGIRFHHTTQTGTQFKTGLVSGVLHVVFSGHG